MKSLILPEADRDTEADKERFARLAAENAKR